MQFHSETKREVVIGSNSAVWRALSKDSSFSSKFLIAISHGEVDNFRFEPTDRVWIFSYSRQPSENEKLMKKTKTAGARETVYISTAAANISSVTRCYEYPYVKYLAESSARQILDARILTLGLMYHSPTELPAGATAATSYGELARFMQDPQWPQDRAERKLLFSMIRRPFGDAVEKYVFNIYGTLMKMSLYWPCILRPIDLLLRFCGYRWYGYLFLSNRIWFSTIS